MSHRRVWARNLQAARAARGVSQERVARHLDCSAQNVSRWERGATVPRDATKLRLAEFYGIPVAELFPWDDNGAGEAA